MIPEATTSVRIERPAARAVSGEALDPYDGMAADSDTPTEPTLTTVAHGVRAVIGKPKGAPSSDGAQRSLLDDELLCDPVPLLIDDYVHDELTGRRYIVQWVDQRPGLGIDHTVAGIRRDEAVRV